MSSDTEKDQSKPAAPEDAPRPPDNAIVTSDIEPPEPVPEPRETGSEGDQPAAAAKPDDEKGGGSNDDQAPAAGDEKPPQSRNRSAERRIKKLTGKLSRVSDQNEALLRENQRLQRENEQFKASVNTQPEPDIKDFESPAEYAKAYNEWDAAQKAAKKSPPSKQPPPDEQPPATGAEPQEPDAVRKKFFEDGQAMLGDEFNEAIQEEGTAISPMMAEFLFDSEVGPAIYVHLANNQEDSKKIYDMTPRKAVKALEELEAKAAKGELDIEGQLQIESPPDDKGGQGEGKPSGKESAQPGGSRAPTPPSDTQDRGSPNTDPNPDSESMDDYAARRRREIRRSRGYP